MKGLLIVSFLCAAIASGGWLASSNAAGVAGTKEGQTVAVRLGDRIRVVGAPIGCRVVRMRELGRIVIDCRRAGKLAGTYGTLITARKAAVVRFSSRREAKFVVVATHDGDVRRCE